MPLQASPARLSGRFPSVGFALAFSVALLPRASCFALAFSMLRFLGLHALHSCSRSLQSLELFSSQKFSKKQCSQSTRNALKRIVVQRTSFTPLNRYSGVAQGANGDTQAYPPHVTPRVPRSVHVKFHANWPKNVSAR